MHILNLNTLYLCLHLSIYIYVLYLWVFISELSTSANIWWGLFTANREGSECFNHYSTRRTPIEVWVYGFEPMQPSLSRSAIRKYLNYLYLWGQLCELSGIDSSLLNTVWSVSFLPIGKWKCRCCKLPVTGTWVHWCQWKQLMYLLNKLYIGFWCKHSKHKHNNQTKAPVTSSSLHETACWRLLQHGATTLSTEHFDVGFTCTTASTATPTRPPRLTRTIEDRWLRRRVHVITANKQQQAV